MTDLLDEQLRDELQAVAATVEAPTGLVQQVSERLVRRRRRRTAAAAAGLLVCAAVGSAVALSPSPHHSRPPAVHHAPRPRPQPSIYTPAVVHGPALTETVTGRTLRAVRTVLLPGARSPITGMTVGDTFYVDATLTTAVALGNYQRLVRVAGRSGRVEIAPLSLRAPTAPVAAYGEIWVADRHRLVGYDPRSLVVRRVVRLPGDLPGEVAAAGGFLWVAGWTHLDRVDPSDGALLQVSPSSADERFAGVAATASGQLFSASSHLPDITENIGTIERRNPVTGAVNTTRTGLGLGASDVAGVTGRDLWLRDAQGGMSNDVARIDTASLTVRTAAAADNTIAVTVSDGLPWVSSSALNNTSGHGALFECLAPSTGEPQGLLSLHRFPGKPADLLPAGTVVPQFLAAGPHEMFVAVNRVLVVYPADPSCTP